MAEVGIIHKGKALTCALKKSNLSLVRILCPDLTELSQTQNISS